MRAAYSMHFAGKTYTMGSEYKPNGHCSGVIPDAINAIFSRIESTRDSECTVRVSFVEIHKVRFQECASASSAYPTVAQACMCGSWHGMVWCGA